MARTLKQACDKATQACRLLRVACARLERAPGDPIARLVCLNLVVQAGEVMAQETGAVLAIVRKRLEVVRRSRGGDHVPTA